MLFHSIMTKRMGGHFSEKKTVAKLLQCGFYWPTLFRDAFEYYRNYPMMRNEILNLPRLKTTRKIITPRMLLLDSILNDQ